MSDFDKNIYYLGTLCKRGHSYGNTNQSLRVIKTNHCIICRRENVKNYRKKHLVKSGTYIGKLCKNNHRYNNTNFSKRYSGSNVCTKCLVIYNKKRRKKLQSQDKFYIGSLCKYSHKYNNENKSLRYTSNGSCVCCDRQHSSRCTDKYIKQLLINIGVKTCHKPELISLKRQQIKLYRQILEAKNGINRI